jgi:ribosomal protein S8
LTGTSIQSSASPLSTVSYWVPNLHFGSQLTLQSFSKPLQLVNQHPVPVWAHCTTLRHQNMSLVNLAHVCSHIQNASKARLGLTSVPSSNLHLTLLLALQNSGFISSVTRGGLTPPPIDQLSSYEPEPVTQSNIATRRLWLGLKYWNNEPVLSEMKLVSKPTKRVWMDVEGLGKIIRGREAGYVKGLTKPGESLFVSTDRGILEARECVERKVGGMLLCRVV